MKLFFTPGACSLSPHIVLREAGLSFEIEQVDLLTRKTAGGKDYYTVTSKGYVPALMLDDGQVLTEGPAIVQYIADLVPEKRLAPPAGSMERYRLMEWLNFITSELHKSYGIFFKPGVTEDVKNLTRANLVKKLDFVEQHLSKNAYLMGNEFTVADAYLFTIAGWSPYVNLDLAGWPALKAYHERIAERPAVKAAMQAEGLIKS